MKKRKNWKDGCTAAQRRHVKENKVVTRADFEATRAHQINNGIPCHDCRSIAIRIGFES